MMRGMLAGMFMVLGLPALAQGLRGDLFPTDAACYLRYYDDAHLAAHPQQRVRQIAIGPDPAQTTVAGLALRLHVQLREDAEFYTATAYCTEGPAGLDCGIEGDGGGFALDRSGRGLQLTVKRAGMILEGSTRFQEISGTQGDDRVFRLPTVPADSCP
jgi:hypothetical protein